MDQMMAGRAKEYFELPAEERIAYLDKVIDTMQSRRREFESVRREFERRRGGPRSRREEFGPRREDPGTRRGEFEARREQAQYRSDAPNGQQRPRRGPRRRGRRRSPERMRARTEFVDPKTRTQRAKFREALRQRMRERGIDFRPPRR